MLTARARERVKPATSAPNLDTGAEVSALSNPRALTSLDVSDRPNQARYSLDAQNQARYRGSQRAANQVSNGMHPESDLRGLFRYHRISEVNRRQRISANIRAFSKLTQIAIDMHICIAYYIYRFNQRGAISRQHPAGHRRDKWYSVIAGIPVRG